MTRIAIVTDSTASLPPELVERYDIHVIPCRVIFEGQVFRDGVDITPAQFYQMLQKAPDLPTTSQPSIGEFVELYRALGRKSEAIVSIHIAEPLSGTLACAYATKRMLSSVSIEIIDSQSVSMGLGFITLAAARAAAEGKEVAEVVTAARELIPRMSFFFVVDTLEYLAKGGRIGGASALMGSVLQIKPILHIAKGRIEVLKKVRSKGKAQRRLLEIMEARIGSASSVHAAVLHAAAPEEAQAVREELARRFNCAELYVSEFSPALGTHAGPGMIGVAFYAEG